MNINAIDFTRSAEFMTTIMQANLRKSYKKRVVQQL